MDFTSLMYRGEIRCKYAAKLACNTCQFCWDWYAFTSPSFFIATLFFSMQDIADISKQFPELAEDIHIPEFFEKDQFFSSVFRISSPGLQLWTHYDV